MERSEVHNASLRSLSGRDTLCASQPQRHLRDRGLLDQRYAGSATGYVVASFGRGDTCASPGEQLVTAADGGEGGRQTQGAVT